MTPFKDYLRAVGISVLIILALGLTMWAAHARDLGQWENTDPTIHEWYQTLTQPGAPYASCCTEADAYWADVVHVKDGKTYAVITDDRLDGPLGRPHIANGTEFEVPPEKLKYDRGNPTGHAILFVSTAGYTWCYVQSSGT
jgi:hypothetical protein